MKIAFLFPGQGAQYAGMGKDLYEKFPIAKELFENADTVLGTPVSEICFDGPESELKKTEITQPAVLLVSYICAKLLELKRITADGYAGFSLGEYTALAASGIVSIGDALRIARARGLIIEKAYPEGKGGMAAVLGLDDSIVEKICAGFGDKVTPANYNCPNQIVISGEKTALAEACKKLEEAGAKRTIMLNVSGPFHSPLLAAGAPGLARELNTVNLAPLGSRKIVSNTTAKYHTDAGIKVTLARHMHSPVLWSRLVKTLFDDGFDTFVEVGPGKVLAGFMKGIDRSRKVINVYDCDSLDAAVMALGG